MSNSRDAFLICLYGLLDSQRRSKIEMNGYRAYLQACSRYILRYAGKKAVIVLAGGYTTELAVSEAASVKYYFRQWLASDEFLLLLEERSKDTEDNLRLGWEQIKNLELEISSLTIFCDRYRHGKVWALAWHLLRKEKIRWQVKSFPRQDIHPNSSWRVQIPEIFKALFFGGRRLGD